MVLRGNSSVYRKIWPIVTPVTRKTCLMTNPEKIPGSRDWPLLNPESRKFNPDPETANTTLDPKI